MCLTVGNTDGWAKTIEQLMNVWREGKDSVEEKQGLLVEEYVFAPPSVAVKPWGVNIVTVKVDEEGMAAGGKGGLEDVLENWDYNKGQRPHVIYTVTYGKAPHVFFSKLTKIQHGTEPNRRCPKRRAPQSHLRHLRQIRRPDRRRRPILVSTIPLRHQVFPVATSHKLQRPQVLRLPLSRLPRPLLSFSRLRRPRNPPRHLLQDHRSRLPSRLDHRAARPD